MAEALCYRVLKETVKRDIIDSMSMKVGPDFLRALADELEKLSGLTAHITSLRLSGHEVYLASDDDAINGKQYTVIGITDKVKTGGNLRDMSVPPVTIGGQRVDHTFGRG